ncbi:Bro-N domain-containing protein [Pseudodesulfovibrio indicus]|uniref:BRO-N domain-containing protein n=1 Tax=Pseudodesulfovibrio indicus TaxID=1716143 RepID=UPI00292D4ABE|nr:Bro-N domain-containing protein [Pseudodesulfovibrio indicus]
MEITLFNYAGATDLRTLTDDAGEPWFVAKDVCDVLGYRMASDAVRALDDDEKGTRNVRTPGGDQIMTLINESGLYSLILRSRKPEAKAFKKWITSEVLPSIRKKGGYMVAKADETPAEIMARAVLLAQDSISMFFSSSSSSPSGASSFNL